MQYTTFPLVILMSIVVLSIDFLKQNIAFYYPILCLLFPALVSVAMAIVRIRVVWGVKQIPELKVTAAFLSIVFLMLLIEKLIYSVFVTPDLLGAIFYLLAFLLSTLWFKMQKEALRQVHSLSCWFLPQLSLCLSGLFYLQFLGLFTLFLFY